MNKLGLIAGMLILIASTISPTSLNSRFVVLNRTSSQLTVQLQINTSSGTDDLGGATIVISFNKAVLSYNSNPVSQTDYIFNNFNSGNYSTAKVTRPLSDKIWINITLPYENNNKGTVVSGSSNWTNVVTLNFNMVAQNDTVLLRCLSGNPFWGVYDGNNTTLWTSGTLTDLNILQVDKTPPDITDVTATNSRSVTVKFSKKLNPNSAQNKNNYSISNSVSINQAQLQPDSTSVLLKTSQQQSNIDYILTITDISDQNGNQIIPNPRKVNYKIATKSTSSNNGKGKIKNTISKVTTSSWEQNFSPDKMIDGLGMAASDSRWESAKSMPDTIIYDFGENVSMDSLNISFYKGESGRLYKYSVYTSKDLQVWNSKINDVWSDDSEWTILEIDSTRSRYIQVILKDCNQGKKSSIWEFESFGSKNKIDYQTQGTPNTFELSQNYPNPFNPSTKINYNIPTLTNSSKVEITVQLKIYDILGNEVATLVDEEKPAGNYEVEFKAENLASGVYIYRLKTSEYTDTKKMLLLR
jgi:hypothetical protein